MEKLPDAVLRGPRVSLTRLHQSNIYQHFAWNNDPELNRLDSEVPFEPESFGAFKRRFERLASEASPSSRDFEIHAEDGTLIGVAFVSRISRHNSHCSLGITICDRAYWGTGYGRETIDLLQNHVFVTLGMHRVTAEVFEFNAAWQKLIEDSGFSAEGRDRDYLKRDGRYWDRIRYALLADDYLRRTEALAAPRPAVRKTRKRTPGTPAEPPA